MTILRRPHKCYKCGATDTKLQRIQRSNVSRTSVISSRWFCEESAYCAVRQRTGNGSNKALPNRFQRMLTVTS